MSSSNFSAVDNSRPLDDGQVAQYRRDGYLVATGILDAGTIENLRREADEIVAGASAVTENTEVYDLEDSHTKAEPRVRRIKFPHKSMNSVKALARHPRLVAALQQLLGDAVRFDTSKLNMKSPGFGAAVEWHQDWAFYPHTNDDLLAVGVMLDDMEEVNGPLMVLPGSHEGPVYSHHHNGYFCGALNTERESLNVDDAVALKGPAGAVTFHHVRMVHGSAMNRSDRPRRLLLLQYTAADAFPLVNFDDDIERYDRQLVAGEPTLVPRLKDVPIRLPLPPAPNQGSIYENQRAAGVRYFAADKTTDEAVQQSLTT